MKTIFIILFSVAFSANAQIYECKSSTGEMGYQEYPCSANQTPVGQLKIKEMTPKEKAEAEAEAKQEEQKEQEEADIDKAEAAAEQKQQDEILKQKELELEERRTRALEMEADTQRKRVLGIGTPYYVPYRAP